MFDSVVLNEASLPFQSVQDCNDNIEHFFDLLHEAKNHNIHFSRVDEIEGDWNQLNYADDFNFNKWLDSLEDRDRRLQIKSVISGLKCPLLNINDNKSNVNVSDLFFLHKGDRNSEVLGLAFAHLNHSHSLSVASNPHWLKDSITIVKVWCEADEDFEKEFDVPNISSIEQLIPFLDKFRARRQDNKDYLTSLTVANNPDFKNLLFTESFLKSVKSYSLQPLDFRRLMSVLASLDQAIIISNNMQDLSDNSSLEMSNESKLTMSDKNLVRLRRFKHPLLGNEIFQCHVKNFTNGKRMYILANYVDKTICVGYFGNHLKTATST